MNYIKQLQKDNEELTKKVAAMQEELLNFRQHLDSPKFTTNAGDNWISTDDVKRWLEAVTM
jgi:cell division septum initiation protein DivIVA